MHDHEAAERVALVERLLEELDTLPDPLAREKATSLVQALVSLYGEGLRRIVDGAHGELQRELGEDELVSHLLLLHGLHPVPVEARVRGALDGVRPYLESHGGNVALVAVEDGVVRLRLDGSCSGCPSSTMTLKLAIEKAIHEAAPDIDEVVAEGATEQPAPRLLQIEGQAQRATLKGSDPLRVEGSDPLRVEVQGHGGGEWAMAGGLPELRGGQPLVKRVAGEELLFLTLGENAYAYRPGCPGCGASLGDASLTGVELACETCGNRYDVMRAGRCLDAPHLHLEPVPLLVDDAGLVTVALGEPV